MREETYGWKFCLGNKRTAMSLLELSISVLIIINALKVIHAFNNESVEEMTCASCTCPNKSATHCDSGESSVCRNGTLYDKVTNECILNSSTTCEIKRSNRRPEHSADRQCIKCQCGNRDTSCKFGPLCHCNNGIFYPNNNKKNCAQNLTQCGIFLDGSNISEKCLTCKCAEGHSFCKYENTACNCMRGTVYRHENHNECAHQREECIKMPHKRNATNEQAQCASCTCPRNAAACDINECLCSAGRLFLTKEHRCAFNQQECDLPEKDGNATNEQAQCAFCTCPKKAQACDFNNCLCAAGILFVKEDNNCAFNEQECGLPAIDNIPTPEKDYHCAPCKCDDNQRECPILGTMCDCVNLRLISRETGKCVIDKDDCGALINPPRIPTPDKEDHCAPCQCSDNQPVCAMVGSICDCVNGRLKFRQTEKCAVNKDDCGALLVAPRIPTADKEHHCAPCECDDNQQECPILGTMCDCVNLRLISRDTGKCVIDKDDCGALLLHPRIPTPDKDSHCAPCHCNDNQPVCDMIGSRCDCVNGRLHLRETGRCVINKDDCGALFVPPRIHKEHGCAMCNCPENIQTCPVEGTSCDCVNKVFRYKDTGKCVQNSEDCRPPIRSWTG